MPNDQVEHYHAARAPREETLQPLNMLPKLHEAIALPSEESSLNVSVRNNLRWQPLPCRMCRQQRQLNLAPVIAPAPKSHRQHHRSCQPGLLSLLQRTEALFSGGEEQNRPINQHRKQKKPNVNRIVAGLVRTTAVTVRRDPRSERTEGSDNRKKTVVIVARHSSRLPRRVRVSRPG